MCILNLITFIARSENTFACNQSFTHCLFKPQLSLPQHLSVLSFIVQMCSWIATEQNSFQLKGHKIILKTNEKTGEHRTVFFLFCFVFATMLQHDYTLRNVPYSKCNA